MGCQKWWRPTSTFAWSTALGDVLAQRSLAAGEDISDTYLRFTVRERTPAQVEVTAGDGSFEPVVVSVLLLPGQQFIDVSAPMAGDKICGRALILGYSSTSGGKVIGAALDANGETLAQGTGAGGERGEYAPFFVGLNPERRSRNVRLPERLRH